MLRLAKVFSGDHSFFVNDVKTSIFSTINSYGSSILVDEFLSKVDISSALEEGWSQDDLLCDIERYFEIPLPGGTSVAGYIEGHHFSLFATDGALPDCLFELPVHQDIDVHLELSHEDTLAWVLLPYNSPLLKTGADEYEQTSKLLNGFNIFATNKGNTRLQRISAANGAVLGGVDIEDGEVTTIFVIEEYRRKGVASDLIELARKLIPDLTYSSIRTKSGRAFFQAIEIRDSEPAQPTALTY